MPGPSPLHRLVAQHFDEPHNNKQSKSFLSQPEHTIWVSRHRTLRDNFYIWVFFLKAAHNSWKLWRLLQVAKFLFMYSFTNLLFRHLPTEIVIFINVCYQMKCFSGESFSFFYEQVLLIFRLLFWFHVKFKQSIQRH